MSNRFEQVYGLTMLSPILGGRQTGAQHAAAIRAVLAAQPTGERNPFARVPATHFARWVVLDDMPTLDTPAREDHLASGYLLFTSDFDGDLHLYCDFLATALPMLLTDVYSHCVGFPGVTDLREFYRYVKKCQVNTTLLFGGYPGATVQQVLVALQTQRVFRRFLATTQRDEPVARQAAFRTMMRALADAPPPPPGAVL
jgi:hypothetical protein